jgi:hypothetical protein
MIITNIAKTAELILFKFDLTNLQNAVKQFWVLFDFIQFKYEMLKNI